MTKTPVYFDELQKLMIISAMLLVKRKYIIWSWKITKILFPEKFDPFEKNFFEVPTCCRDFDIIFKKFVSFEIFFSRSQQLFYYQFRTYF